MKKRTKCGQSSIELVAGLLIMIPIALATFDLCVIIMCEQKNEAIAKNAARAAARCIPHGGQYEAYRTSYTEAQSNGGVYADSISDGQPEAVARGVVNSYKDAGNFVSGIAMQFKDVSSNDFVVQTDMDVRLPVPFPGWSIVRIRAAAHEAYTSVPFQSPV